MADAVLRAVLKSGLTLVIEKLVEIRVSADVGKLATQAKNAIKKKPELVNAISEQECVAIAEKLMAAPEKLLAQFTAFMDDAVLLSIDNLSLASVFDDYFKSVPPFNKRKQKKRSFRMQ